MTKFTKSTITKLEKICDKTYDSGPYAGHTTRELLRKTVIDGLAKEYGSGGLSPYMYFEYIFRHAIRSHYGFHVDEMEKYWDICRMSKEDQHKTIVEILGIEVE